MISIVKSTCDGQDCYDITFPYDRHIVELVKLVPGRRWHPDEKKWTIPLDNLGMLINQLKASVYSEMYSIITDEQIDENETLESSTPIPNIDVSQVPFYVGEGFTPLSHQIDFMKWAINRQNHGNLSGFILADEMGLGKSVESTNLAIYNRRKYRFKHCLIICCVNSGKYSWYDDIKKHTRGKVTPYILGSRKKRDGSIRANTGSKEKYEDLLSLKMYNDDKGDPLPYFLILNIEALRYKQKRLHPIADRLIELINQGIINMVLIDEIHKNASPQSQQGKQLLRIKTNTKKRAMWIPITGTPITKTPTDVFTPLKLIDGHPFKSYYTWCKHYCIYGGFGGYEIIGYKNIPELKASVECNMIRRLKDDVLDLPPKIRYTEYVDNTPYQNKLYRQVESDILDHRDEVLMSPNPMARLLRLRQVNGSPELVDLGLDPTDPSYLSKNAKLQRLLELLEDANNRGEKTLVFSNWVEPLRTVYRYVSKHYKTCSFTGTMSVDDRELNKRRFQEDDQYKVLLGTVGAAGTVQTFTAATNVIFYDSPWNPSDKEQAEDRIYRIGTKKSVNIFTLVSRNTVDDRVEQILETKSGVAKYIVDGRLDLRSNPELFDLLLGRDPNLKK